ncbi:alpha/beta hydrolase [bacterium]|nr:alpha/beta hydrolase [bacterium]
MNELKLITEDKIEIATNHYKGGHDEVVIVAPGWCMTKDSDAFRKISEMFAQKYDVLCFDFRGHGKSEGLYTFMAKEILDIKAIVDFAKSKKYKKIHLAGFSLGAGVAIIYAAEDKSIDKVIAVSAPADFDKIENQMWKKEAWGETFQKFELDRFMSIRPYPIPLAKIKPIEIIKDLQCPTLFVAGKKDPTVHAWHTAKLYKNAKCIKKLHIFDEGCHAEDLYLHFKDEFTSLCLDWLNKA